MRYKSNRFLVFSVSVNYVIQLKLFIASKLCVHFTLYFINHMHKFCNEYHDK